MADEDLADGASSDIDKDDMDARRMPIAAGGTNPEAGPMTMAERRSCPYFMVFTIPFFGVRKTVTDLSMTTTTWLVEGNPKSSSRFNQTVAGRNSPFMAIVLSLNQFVLGILSF